MATFADAGGTEKTTPISAFQFEIFTLPKPGQTDWLPQNKVGFTMVSGLHNSTEAIEYKEGNDLYGDLLPGRSRPGGEVVLTRGLDRAGHLIKWREAILEKSALPGSLARCDVIVDVYDRTGTPTSGGDSLGPLVQRWLLPAAWPKDYAIDDLDSRGGTEITLQRCTMAHYGVPMLIWPTPVTPV